MPTRPWFRAPVLWHSSRIPSGHDYSKMTVAQAAMIRDKWRDWYRADWDYAQTTVAFLCTAILIVAIFDLFATFRHKRHVGVPQRRSIGLADRLIAVARYTSARQFCLQGFDYYSPPLAAILGVSGMAVWTFALMLGTRPYYWPNHEMGHSMPIATRAGWMSIAMLPIMIAMATKVNFIAIITNTSHEKLQVFHRWLSVFMYVTALVHTFPFVVQSIADGTIVTTWKTGSYYWTGVAALIPQTWLVATSWGPLRNRYYEAFKKLHFIAALIFMIALFFHCNYRLTSWDYFWATLAIHSLTWFGRVGRTVFNSGAGLSATIEQLPGPDGLVSVQVHVPKRLKWTPGQHVFIRFLNIGIYALSSHPFTVSSLPVPRRTEDGKEEDRTLDLVFKKRGGITQMLSDLTEGKPSVNARVWIDGPYGGLKVPLTTYDKVYLLAGGTGATMTVPMLVDLAESLGAGSAKCQAIEFVFAVKDNESPAWMKHALSYARSLAKDRLKMHIHVTQDKANPKALALDEGISQTTVGISNNNASVPEEVDTANGRPNLGRIVRDACRTEAGSIAFVACGPESFLYDVRNAVADCQLAIIDGYGAVNEIFLHVETYGW